MSETNLIDEVADRVEFLFREMHPFQDQQAPMKRKEFKKFHDEMAAFSAMPPDPTKLSEKERSKLSEDELRKLDQEYELALDAFNKKAEELREANFQRAKEAQARGEEARKKVVEISDKISEELDRLTEVTYAPLRNDPETPRRMLDFLTRFSRAYANQTTQANGRPAGAILEYLHTSIDHAYWLYTEWVKSALALEDYVTSEQLLEVLFDGSKSSTQAHKFNQLGGPYKPVAAVSKGLIALKRDGDLQLAHKIAQATKEQFGSSVEAVAFYHAICDVKEEVENGNLQLADLRSKARKDHILGRLNQYMPPTALLTGKWTSETETEE